MRPTTVSTSGVSISTVCPVDYRQATFKVSLAIVITGVATVEVQHTFDNIFDPTVTPTWFNHDSLVGITANSDGNYAYPVRAIRLNQTAGAGSAVLTIIQGGSA